MLPAACARVVQPDDILYGYDAVVTVAPGEATLPSPNGPATAKTNSAATVTVDFRPGAGGGYATQDATLKKWVCGAAGFRNYKYSIEGSYHFAMTAADAGHLTGEFTFTGLDAASFALETLKLDIQYAQFSKNRGSGTIEANGQENDFATIVRPQ